MSTLYLLNPREETFFHCASVLLDVAKLVAEANIFGFCTFIPILKSFVTLEGSYGCTEGYILV